MNETTSFSAIYSTFLSKVTDDMYGETWTEKDVERDLELMLKSAITKFRFPRFPIFDYTQATEEEEGFFNCLLTYDEVEILAQLMLVEWLTRQIATYENTKQKVYSSSDFKLSSQANHMNRLIGLKASFESDVNKAQGLYSRRKRDTSGMFKSTMGQLGGGALDN